MPSGPQYKFTGFAPDLPPETPGILTDTDKVLINSKGFVRPQASPVAWGSALPNTVYGATLAQYVDGTQRYFAGTSSTLYENAGGASGTWTSVGTGFSSNTLPGGGWRFAQFGNVCLAQDGVDTGQVATTSGNFTSLSAMPIARVITSVNNNFVFLGNIVSSPDETDFPHSADRWWCCAQADYTNWTPSDSTLCVTGRLLDTPGPITAIKQMGQNLTFLAYKQQGLYLGLFVNVPVIWQFITISRLIGTFSQESVVDIGAFHVFPSYDDFWSCDGGGNLQRIENPIKSWFFSTCNMAAVIAGTSNIVGTFDRIHDVVYWYFPTTSNALDHWVAWNVRSNMWTTGTLAIDAVLYPEVQFSNANPAQAVFQTSDHKAYTFSGAGNPSAYVTTGDMGDNQHFFYVNRIRPYFAAAPADFTTINADGYTKLALGTTGTQVNTAVPMDQYGWLNMRQNGRWNSYTFHLPQDCQMEGFDVVPNLPSGVR